MRANTERQGNFQNETEWKTASCPFFSLELCYFRSVLPAHAGMIPQRPCRSGYAPCAPRACGDDPESLRLAHHAGWCSPRMRG